MHSYSIKKHYMTRRQLGMPSATIRVTQRVIKNKLIALSAKAILNKMPPEDIQSEILVWLLELNI